MKNLYTKLIALLVIITSFSGSTVNAQCLTTTGPTNNCSYGDAIDNINIDGVSVANGGCSGTGTGYTYFPTPVWNFQLGASYPISLAVGGGQYNQGVRIWLDANNDGVFDAAESVYNSSTAALSHTGTLVVPATGVTTATVRMRVMCTYNTTPANTDACVSNQGSYGETEDYEVQLSGMGDAEATALVSPMDNDCGKTQDSLWVRVTNVGSGTLNNIPIVTNLSGIATGTYNDTITSLAASASQDVFVAVINTSAGGTLDVQFYVDSVDANQTNDTLNTSIMIKGISTSTDIVNGCDSVTWIDGNTYYADNTTATYTLTNAAGCDSVVTLDLTVNYTTTGTDIVSACDSLIWIDGNTYYTNNTTATHTVLNAAGCDSIVTLNLTVNTVNIGVTDNSPVLTANADSTTATFQWLDCDNANSVITGAVNQSYTVTVNGNYAVEVTQNGCIDTSACYNVTGIGIKEINNQTVFIYPNPTSDVFTIDLKEHNALWNYSITTIDGRVVVQGRTTNNKVVVDLSEESKGVYFLRISESTLNKVYKIVKQ